MPRVPSFGERTVAAQGLPNARVSEQTINLGPAAQALTGAVRGLGQQFAQEAQEERDRADNASVIEAETALDAYENSALFDPEAGAFSRKGKSAFDLPNQVLPAYDDEVKRLEGTLGSDRAKLAFKQRAGRRRAGIGQQLNRHESQQRDSYYDEQDLAGLRSSQGVAANYYNDPKRIGEELAKQELIIDARGARKGLSPEDIAEAKRSSRSGTQTDVVSRYLARGEFEAGRKYFDSVREQIGGDEATRLEAAFTSERQRQENERKASNSLLQQELSIQMADIRASAASGIPVTQIPDRAVLRQAYGPVRGDAYFSQLQGAQRLSNEVQRLNSLSNSELQALSASYTPKQQQGAAEQAQLSAGLNQQIARVIDARRSDPVAYLQATSPTVAAATQAIEDGEQGSGTQYFNAVEAEKDRLGIRSPFVFPKGLVPGTEAYRDVALLAVNKYRQLPTEAAQWASNGLKSGDPKAVAAAAQLLDAVENIAPSAYTDVAPPLRARASMVAKMIAAGANPERAVQTAIDTQNLNDAVRSTRNRAYGQFQKSNGGALKTYIDRDFDPSVFYSQPVASQVLESEFDRQAGEYFRQTNDIDLARDLAWNDLKRVYGVSEINGRREVVAFPIERFTVTRKQVDSDIESFLKDNPQSDGSVPSDIRVVADSDTLRNVNDGLSGARVRPSYRMVTKTGDLARFKDGTPIRYFVPSDEEIFAKLSEERKRAQEEGKAEVAEAFKYRAKKRAYQEGLQKARDEEFGAGGR